MKIRKINCKEKRVIDEVVQIHLDTFHGFFLTFMGKGFLRQMYSSYCKHSESGMLVAFEDNKPIGFLAYSSNLSGLYKYMIRKKLFPFAWYSLCAFIRKPKVFFRLIRAFLKPNETKRNEKYVELASIGVKPDSKSNGVGSKLINALKNKVDFSEYKYITLETDAVDNEAAIHFYEKNRFVRIRQFETTEGRKMFEYRFGGE